MTRAAAMKGLIAHLLPVLVALTVSVLAVVAWSHNADIRRQIEELGIANSDSTQWSLAQTEVEAMALQRAILLLQDDPADADQADELRKRFDILYSRLQTLRTGRTFEGLRSRTGIVPALDELQAALDGAIPVIDGDDALLFASLDRLAAQAEAALPLVRQISLAGVRQFSSESDLRRQDVVKTLFQLSLMVVPLFLVLVGTTLVLFVMVNAARVQTSRIAATGERMRSLFDASTDAILFARPDGRVRGYNKAAERIYGYEPDEVINGDLIELLTPPTQRDAVRALLAEVQMGRTGGEGSGPAVMQATAQHKSGRVIPVEMSWSVAHDDRGPLLVAYVRDVSRRAQEEAELIEARDRAVAGERAKARLIAVMSHEMRTPLNGILGTLDLLKLTGPDARQRHYLDAMEQSGRMLLRHVNDVLDASRADGAATAAPLDLRAVVGNTVESLQAHAEARGNHITIGFVGEQDGLLLGNALQIEQILINLIGNAIKFTENGSIHVELDRSAGPGQVELRVSDTGIGIAEENLARIFEEFVTLDATFDRTAEGTGLGLSIVRNLVGALDGQIDVESTVGEGTVFSISFCLPQAACPDTTDDAEPAAPLPAAPRNLHVLVVDDNEINRLVVSDMLQHLGCEVEQAADGLRACEIAGRTAFDLILMDISMPRLDGTVAAQRILAEGPNVGTPIVALTAHALPEDLVRFRRAGMRRALLKPLQLRDLTAVLNEVCGAGGEEPAAAEPSLPAGLGQRIEDELRSDLGDLCLSQEDAAARVHRAAGTAALGGFKDLHGRLIRLETALRQGSDRTILVPQLREIVRLLPKKRATAKNPRGLNDLETSGCYPLDRSAGREVMQ